MTRKEYRELFDASYKDVEDLFKENDDRLVVDNLIMFFGFSEPDDYFKMPDFARLTLALGNFNEAFRKGGLSEFLENCGYCLPEIVDFLRLVDCDQIAIVLQNIFLDSDQTLWGKTFFGTEINVTEFCRTNGWFKKESETLRKAEESLLPKMREYLSRNIKHFRDYQI
jgi:hypothetical protein